MFDYVLCFLIFICVHFDIDSVFFFYFFFRYFCFYFILFLLSGWCVLGGGGSAIVITITAPAGPLVPPSTGRRAIVPWRGL